MDFEYTTIIRIESNDLREIFLRTKRGEDFYDVFDDVMSGYDDGIYYNSNKILNEVKEEIERRIAQSNSNKRKTK